MKLKLVLVLLFFSLITPLSSSQAQKKSKTNNSKTAQTAQRKIVYDLSVADTTMHAGLVRQLNNIKRGWPDAQVKVTL
ncbi:hypothetical protein [Pontibacter kalidii]|uniref:hypothetical protein n=1 Tax=Pontibacter kalidii TaxID=2592049 RepID=UPI0022500741|nr:hypothetical protein [Pontibacter kalidii]